VGAERTLPASKVSLESLFKNCRWLSLVTSDCNPGIEFLILGSGIKKFVIPGSRFEIRLTEWSLFWYP